MGVIWTWIVVVALVVVLALALNHLGVNVVGGVSTVVHDTERFFGQAL